MLSENEAFKIVEKNLPNSEILKVIQYHNLYIFQVIIDDPDEGGWDPYYSVNKDTKEFKDFSILIDGDMHILMDRFMKAEEVK